MLTAGTAATSHAKGIRASTTWTTQARATKRMLHGIRVSLVIFLSNRIWPTSSWGLPKALRESNDSSTQGKSEISRRLLLLRANSTARPSPLASTRCRSERWAPVPQFGMFSPSSPAARLVQDKARHNRPAPLQERPVEI